MLDDVEKGLGLDTRIVVKKLQELGEATPRKKLKAMFGSNLKTASTNPAQVPKVPIVLLSALRMNLPKLREPALLSRKTSSISSSDFPLVSGMKAAHTMAVRSAHPPNRK